MLMLSPGGAEGWLSLSQPNVIYTQASNTLARTLTQDRIAYNGLKLRNDAKGI
jgi:hypothetical protein